MRTLNLLALLTLLLLVGSAGPLFAEVVAPPLDPPAAPEAATPRITTLAPLAQGNRSMVVAAHPLAVAAAQSVLAEGGSAVDAALAAQFVLGLVEPQSSGLGGGAFLLAYDAKTRRVRAYDGRETAPGAATPDRFLDGSGKPLPFDAVVRTGKSIGVPGLVRLAELVHARHGRVRWSRLLKPAIDLAERGFAVPNRLGGLLDGQKPASFDDAARALLFPAGKPRTAGSMMTNLAYAASLRAIATGGADAFYEGVLADQVVTAARAAGSDLTKDDLKRYRARERAAVCVPYRHVRVCGMGPPSSGGIAIAQILMMLEGFDLRGGASDSVVLQAIVEAEKLAFADRDRYLADADFVAVPAGLLAPRYITMRRNLIDTAKPMPKAEPGVPPGRVARYGADTTVEVAGTTHISVVDARGNAASMSSSIEAGFGSGVLAGGFLLNNQLTDFSFLPADGSGRLIANRVQPGKRPRSSMAPTIVLDRAGRVAMVTGSPGGSRIIGYVVKSLICVIDWRCGANIAVSLGNFGSRNGPLEIEKGTEGDALARSLAARGNTIERSAMTSGLAVIVRTGKIWTGAADPRRDGVARGD